MGKRAKWPKQREALSEKKLKLKGRLKAKHLRPTKGMRGQLIRGYVERMSREGFYVFWDDLKLLLHRKAGLYALYQDGKLHYVGMSENLFGRLLTHTRDRHKEKWDNFSVYVINRFRYIKDLEAIVLRLGEHQGNKNRGKFPRRFDFRRRLSRAVRDEHRILDKMWYSR